MPVSTLVVGLGNPGPEYERTRHNMGFLVADALAAASPGCRWKRRGAALGAEVDLEGKPVLLAKPLTYMNRCGEAVRWLLGAEGLGPDSLVVVVDDFNLPFGRLRIRLKGSPGGHNGLESVIGAVGSDEFARLRIGIGEESMPADRAEFVLEDFPAGRRKELEEVVGRSADAVRTIVRDGAARAMADYNSRRDAK